MLDVLTSGQEDDADDGEERDERWRLLVLEDTGELLTADAKARTGQGLSRFLNVVDGLIGQGLRIVVLVTTNEPLGSLHPAAARPGRCAASVEFVPFPAGEAREWLAAHGSGDVPAVQIRPFTRHCDLPERVRSRLRMSRPSSAHSATVQGVGCRV